MPCGSRLQPRLKSIEFLDCFGHAQRRRSRSASACAACAPRVGYCDLEFICNLVLVPALARLIWFILPACGFAHFKL